MSEQVINYTAHHNWAWVLKQAIDSFNSEQTVNQLILKFSELPSQKVTKSKPTYSLFRIEVIRTLFSDTILKSHATSLCFAHLDPKDALLRDLMEVGVESCMPRTTLIAWDGEHGVKPEDFPTYPALLKAALGSGGFGLYYVYTPTDVMEVIKAHKARAERVEGFLDGLRRDYQAIPSWSLQQLVRSVRVTSNDNRKCQIRGYIVECNGRLYLYHEYEVRVPCWDIDLDTVLEEELQHSREELPVQEVNANKSINRWSEEVENECCGAGNARPYNECRNKSKTERYLLNEISELNGTRTALQQTMKKCFGGIKNSILSKNAKFSATAAPLSSTMAIAGIDLLVSRKDTASPGCDNPESFDAYIVEINNNPAMPGPTKHMSPLYRDHLITLVSSILKLGLREAIGSEENEWSSFPSCLDPNFQEDLNNKWELL